MRGWAAWTLFKMTESNETLIDTLVATLVEQDPYLLEELFREMGDAAWARLWQALTHQEPKVRAFRYKAMVMPTSLDSALASVRPPP